MSLAIVHSRAQAGVLAPEVCVEVHITSGLPGLAIVGMPETAVRESKDRVRSAILSARFEFPLRRITVNLAPADLPKEGGRFDLPVAVGILAASGQIPDAALSSTEFLGELSLTGALRPIPGALPAALRARDAGRTLVLPEESAGEAALAQGTTVLAARHLLAVCAHLSETQTLPMARIRPPLAAQPAVDLQDVKGQYRAKRALEVAAAGAHHLLMVGPPGTGKTMLATRLPGILPDMTESEALETAAVHSVSTGGFDPVSWANRPFRAPHHTASGVALVGGGSVPRPGEISLAHNGVLFLDELPEFDRRVLEVLREPLESGRIIISRASRQAEFPARFQLVGAMNPCPGSRAGGGEDCTGDERRRYLSRLSGPLLDRFDIHMEVPRVPHTHLEEARSGDRSETVRARVEAARCAQLKRAGKPNGALSSTEVDRDCALGRETRELLNAAVGRLGLSARGYHRVIKLARTIADLAAEEHIGSEHLMEAIGYRSLDRVLS